MSKLKLTIEQKKLETDLWIITIATLAVLGFYIALQAPIDAISRNTNIHILLRLLLGFGLQFGLAGLGITIVSFVRKESFASHGLGSKGAVLSIILCTLCFMPQIIYMLLTNQVTSYMPFQAVMTTKGLLASGFPTNVVGIFLTAVAWGFFEGFNYVVISDKINKRYPTKNKWLNWGAITCFIVCVLVHGSIGVTLNGIIEMLTIFIIIYGMIMVKQFTGNAWGCVFTFIFLWNAF